MAESQNSPIWVGSADSSKKDKLIQTLAGKPHEREFKHLQMLVEKVNAFEPTLKGKTDEELGAMSDALKARVQKKTEGIQDEKKRKEVEKKTLDEILPEAFALVREAAIRTIGMRHFDVQMMAGITMHEGKIAEMKTGEGKTLAATLSLYLNALTGRGVRLVTANDYLAQRDGGWMGSVFNFLRMRVGFIGKQEIAGIYDPTFVDTDMPLDDERLVHWRPVKKREGYEADITYGTAAEFGFDYLRDHTAIDVETLRQRPGFFVLIDEVDSVLIDSARTPLIMTAPAEPASPLYKRFRDVVEQAQLVRNTSDIEHREDANGDYVLDDRNQTISLTDTGILKIEQLVEEIGNSDQGLYDAELDYMVPYLENALKAKYIFHENKDYIVENDQVILIDQTTGRPMPTRRYSEGLHQALEVKHSMEAKNEDVTIASITIQNYFRQYEKLAGMTGTAKTQAEEFDKIYKMDVVSIPTHVEHRVHIGQLQAIKRKEDHVNIVTYIDPQKSKEPLYFARIDYQDQVFTTVDGKLKAVAEAIEAMRQGGRPVLVGTGSIEESESLSNLLRQKGLPHSVLNGKNHKDEALLIAHAGRLNTITISTSMAGRGTDIPLGGDPEGLAVTRLLAEIGPLFFEHDDLMLLVQSIKEGRMLETQPLVNDKPFTFDEKTISWVAALLEKPPLKGKDIVEKDVFIESAMTEYAIAQTNFVHAIARKDLDRARLIIQITPGFSEYLIDEVVRVYEECAQNRKKVRQLGGLHVIGTVRYESRRIDDQLRGRASRQGDPGSSQFYLSLDDDLMQRFGGAGAKRMMASLNIPDDMPISDPFLTRVIGHAQVRFEDYNFEIRKSLFEDDEVINFQRGEVYAMRDLLLFGDPDKIKEVTKRAIDETLANLVKRYHSNYLPWAKTQIEETIERYTHVETGEVHTEQVLSQTRFLFVQNPGVVNALEKITDSLELSDALLALTREAYEAGRQREILFDEANRVVRLIPTLRVNPKGAVNWDQFVEESKRNMQKYGKSNNERAMRKMYKDMSDANDRFKESIEKGFSRSSVAEFFQNLDTISRSTFSSVTEGMTVDEVVASLTLHADEIFEQTHQKIDQEIVTNYERTLLLKSLDFEWRQYLDAVEAVRAGIGNEAVVGKDPKVELKRKTGKMYGVFLSDLEEAIAKRFFAGLSGYRSEAMHRPG